MLALKNAKANFETAKQELKDYKDKAARILQVTTLRGIFKLYEKMWYYPLFVKVIVNFHLHFTNY